MAKKKRGGAAANARKSLSERQNVAPGTRTEADIRPPPPAADGLADSMAVLEARAAQMRAAQQSRQRPEEAALGAGAVRDPAGLAEFNDGAEKAMAGEWAAALKSFSTACELNPDAPAAFWHYRGLAAHRDGKLQAGIDSLRRAVRIGGHQGSDELLMRLEEERLAEVVVSARRAGDAALESEQYPDAALSYGEAIEAVGARAPALRATCHHGRAFARAMADEWAEALGDWESAVSCCAQLEEPDPMLPMYHHYRGLSLQQLGRPEDAASALRAAVALGSERSAPLLAKLEGAERAAEGERGPAQPTPEWLTLWEAGWRHFAADESVEAISALAQALASGAPDKTDGYLCMGFAHAKLEQWREGVAAMTTGLGSAPSAEDEPDWTFQGLSRAQLETARQNCAGMAAKTGLQQMQQMQRAESAAVVIQSRARGWLGRRSAAPPVHTGAGQQQQQQQQQQQEKRSPRAEVLSPAIRTSPGTRKSISLEATELDDSD